MCTVFCPRVAMVMFSILPMLALRRSRSEFRRADSREPREPHHDDVGTLCALHRYPPLGTFDDLDPLVGVALEELGIKVDVRTLGASSKRRGTTRDRVGFGWGLSPAGRGRK